MDIHACVQHVVTKILLWIYHCRISSCLLQILPCPSSCLSSGDNCCSKMITHSVEDKPSLNVTCNVHVSISAFTGRVYNVTPFLKYHPGGKAQLMKGAGIDCTALFDKVHLYPGHFAFQNTLWQLYY